MGDFWNFVGVSVHPLDTVLGVGEFKFVEINICIEYMLPTIWGVYDSGKYMLILDISCKHLEDECKLEGFCVPGHRVDLPITSDISSKEFHY